MTKFGLVRVSIVALALASVLSLASAQIDPRAKELLDGLSVATSGETIRTIDQVTVTTIFASGESQEMRSRTVIDYDNRRMLVENELGEGLVTRMVLKDGEVTMTMAGMPFALPVPPGTAEQLEAAFGEPNSVVLNDGDTATYDGVVDYGIVKGEQVSYTTTVPGSDEPTTVQYLFQDGHLIAMHIDTDGSEMLMVYDAPVTTALLAGLDITTYMLDAGAWSKFSHTHFESVAINEALDESLFD